MSVLKQLQQLGGISSTDTVRKTAKWHRGPDDIVNVEIAVKKELSYGSVERITLAFYDDERSRFARIVAEGVLWVDDDDNELPVPYAVAEAMRPDLLGALKQQYDEVHQVAPTAALVPDEGEPKN